MSSVTESFVAVCDKLLKFHNLTEKKNKKIVKSYFVQGKIKLNEMSEKKKKFF